VPSQPSQRTDGLRDARTWLRGHGYPQVAALIDEVMADWARQGKRTRRNWWDVLAGDRRGRSRRVGGVMFPVLAAAQSRQGRQVTPRAVAATSARRAKRGVAAPPPVRPFLKWAGGKRQLQDEILSHLPDKFGSFHEPFVGGGAVFFALRPRAAVLSDSNERLIRAYRGVKNQVDQVIDLLARYRNDRQFFLELRKQPVDDGSDAEVAAWLIYLNKTGFNGLYRVNSKNQFNVPFGDNKNAQICDEQNLRACAAALAGAELHCEDFSAVLDRARPGDVVYFDPPYVPLSVTSYFTSYTSQGFGMKEHRKLRDTALQLRKRGVFVLLSNSSAAAVKDLYGPPFHWREVSALRRVNSKAERRGPITELLIE
jgi:DNA adenine methylase